MINWIPLQRPTQLDEIIERSNSVTCLIFKHSTSCSISAMAKYRLESNWSLDNNKVEPYYLDLLRYRPISNQIAETFSVHHESPQVLLIRNSECFYDESHLDIKVDEIEEEITI